MKVSVAVTANICARSALLSQGSLVIILKLPVGATDLALLYVVVKVLVR